MSRHRNIKALDYDQEYDDYYQENDEDDDEEFDFDGDEIEDFEARYLKTGIDLNLNHPTQPIQSHISDQKQSPHTSTTTALDDPIKIVDQLNSSHKPKQFEGTTTILLDPSGITSDNGNSGAGVTISESLLSNNLKNLHIQHSTCHKSVALNDVTNKTDNSSKHLFHPTTDCIKKDEQHHLVNQYLSETLSKAAIQHLNQHQWQLPLLEMDCIFRDNTYFKHYADSYMSTLESKLGLFMADLQLKEQTLQNRYRSENIYVKRHMIDMLVEYYRSLHTNFFSFSTPSPDEEIAIGCRFGSKAKPFQAKMVNPKKGPDNVVTQQTRFEYSGTKTTKKSSSQEPSTSTSAFKQRTQNKKPTNSEQSAIEQDETIRTDFDPSRIRLPKAQENKSFVVPGQKSSTEQKQVDPTTIKPYKIMLNKQNPPKQLLSIVEKRKTKLKDAPEKHIGPTKQVMESFKEQSKDNLKEYKRLKANEKATINLIVVGHVDAGKSTLVGHLLFDLGLVSNKLMHRYTTDSQRSGKASFKFAWILDETDEERLRGVTMDLASTRFETQHRDINLLDAPGHSDFIPSVITGAAQTDAAILVVDATIGEFETGFENGGQTREHTLLIRSLGVKSLVVAINKMDNIDWNETRFNHVVEQLKPFIKQVGYNLQKVRFVPCSGLTGSNLTTKLGPSKDSSHPQLEKHYWYSGPTLLECLDELELPERAIDKPLRLCVTDVFKGMSSGVFLSGTLEGGRLQEKQKLLLMPQNEFCEVKSIEVKDVKVNQAFAGDMITLVTTGLDLAKYYRGSILCDPTIPTCVTNRFQVRIVTFNDIDTILLKGSPVEIHLNGMTESGRVRKLVSLLSKSTGDLIQKRPKCIAKNSSAIIEIVCSRVLCVELYENYKNLGRILLRSMGKTVAAGLICRVRRPKKEKPKEKHRK